MRPSPAGKKRASGHSRPVLPDQRTAMGAAVNYRTRTGRSALWYAKNFHGEGSEENRKKVIQILEAHKAKVFPVRGRHDYYEGEK